MTVEELVTKGIEELESANVPESQLNAMYLLEYVTHIGRMEYLLDKQRQVSPAEEEAYFSAIATRKKRTAHISSKTEKILSNADEIFGEKRIKRHKFQI